jgi:hypothetical protein
MRCMPRARVEDIYDIALGLPATVLADGTKENPILQVRGKSFVFFRNPRPDAVDPQTGERLTDVIVFWVGSPEEKQALLSSDGPFFTTPHFDGHPSVLVRASRIGELERSELTEIIQDAWLARAPKRLARDWLADPPAQPRG